MDDTPVHVLRDIARTYGTGVLDDPRRCRALLMDFCGEYRGEINLLGMALQEGVPQDLADPTPNLPHGLLVARLEQRLRDGYFLPPEAAAWAVAACESALAPADHSPAGRRVFRSATPAMVTQRPWLSADRSWQDVGQTPGEIVLPDGLELRLSARVGDPDAEALAGDLTDAGGVDCLDLGYGAITDRGMAAAVQVPGVAVLDVSRTSVTLMDVSAGTSPNLRELNLWGCDGVTDEGLRTLGQFTALERVDLGRCTRVSDVGVGHLAGLQRLVVLCLSGTRVTDTGLQRLGDLPSLRELDLSGTAITGVGLRHLARNKALESLDLAGCVSLRPTTLGVFRDLRGLVTLNLSRCGLVDDRALVHLRPLAGLRELSLEGLDVTDTGALYLRDLTALTHLSVAWTQVGDAGVARISDLHDLQRLSLAGTRVTDAGLGHLAHARALGELDLANTAVSDAGLRRLAGLASLSSLDLEGTAVRDAGLVHLGALPGLRRLYLGGTAITDAGLTLLARIADLEVVDVALCPSVTGRGVEALAAAGVTVVR